VALPATHFQKFLPGCDRTAWMFPAPLKKSPGDKDLEGVAKLVRAVDHYG